MSGAAKKIFNWKVLCKAIIWSYIGFLLVGCSIESQQITKSGQSLEPHIAWNGTHFGIVYYHRSAPGLPLDINLVVVDPDGKIFINPIKLGTINSGYHEHFVLSDLVWDSINKQFAFAYSYDKIINFIRVDSKLNSHVTKITGNLSSYWKDLSLVWAKEKNEYALSYINQEVQYSPEAQRHVFLSRIGPDGKFKTPTQFKWIIKGIAPDGCERTSLAYNSKENKYALAYFSNRKPMIAFIPTNVQNIQQVSIHPIGSYSMLPEAVKLVYDRGTGDYLYLMLGYAGELSYDIVDIKGKVKSSYNWSKNVDKIFSADVILPNAAHKYVLMTSENQEVRCWLIGKQGTIEPKLPVPTAGQYTSHPCVVVPPNGVPYMAWIQDNNLYFGRIKVAIYN